MLRTSLLILISLLINSCFKQFIKSDKKIAEHYNSRSIKPTYHILDTLGLKIHYATVCTDSSLPLLIMVHGAPGAWYGWLPQLDDTVLQKNFRMLALDRPGYNKSRQGRMVNDIDSQTMIVNKLVEMHKEGKKAIIMGRSYGSPIALMAAAQYPDKVDALVLISSATDSASEKYYWFSKLGKKKFVRWLLPTSVNSATDEKYAHPLQLGKAREYYSKVKCPSVIIYGDKDYVAYNANSIKLDSEMVGCPHKLICIKGADHFIAVKKPEIVRDELLGLLPKLGLLKK